MYPERMKNHLKPLGKDLLKHSKDTQLNSRIGIFWFPFQLKNSNWYKEAEWREQMDGCIHLEILISFSHMFARLFLKIKSLKNWIRNENQREYCKSLPIFYLIFAISQTLTNTLQSKITRIFLIRVWQFRNKKEQQENSMINYWCRQQNNVLFSSKFELQTGIDKSQN